MSDCCDHHSEHTAPQPRDWRAWQRSALALVWAATFLLTALGPWSTILVAPWQRVVLIGASLIMILLAALRAKGHVHIQRTPSATESAIHVLPLLMLLLIPPRDAGSAFIDQMGWGSLRSDNPMIMRAALDQQPNSSAIQPPPLVNELSLSGSGGRIVLRAEEDPSAGIDADDINPHFQHVNLLTCYRGGPEWEGRAVEVIVSIAHLSPERRKQLPPEVAALNAPVMGFRLVMICCIADAWPISVAISGANIGDADEDSWVRVRGTLQRIETPRGPMLHLTAQEWQAVPRPRNPYLSPL